MTAQGTRIGSPATAGFQNRSFANTHWSMVMQAADNRSDAGHAALRELCRAYWYPLYGFARRRGHSAADAQDLTQGFFAYLLERHAIARADPGRGRFRTYLLAMFEHYRAHEHERAMSQKRGGATEIVSFDAMQAADARFQKEPATQDSPERIFDRKWAVSLLDQAMAAVRQEYVSSGKGALFEELKAILGGAGERYVDIAGRLGVSEGSIKVAVHRARHRFAEQVRVEVAKTVLQPQDVDDELRHLFAALAA